MTSVTWQPLAPVSNLDLSTVIQTHMSNSKLDTSLGLLCQNSRRLETHGISPQTPSLSCFLPWEISSLTSHLKHLSDIETITVPGPPA